MIPYNTITAWGVTHPWSTREQIEQDMLLSKALCDIYNNEKLAGELVFRGGTALHKLILDEPYRYSEDLDFVRTTSGGIGPIMKELTSLGIFCGYRVNTKMGQHPKVYWLGETQTGVKLRIKIEINTYERTPALPFVKIKHKVNSDWYTGEANVIVFQNEEIAASKLRALFQRSKGRDLFDLWLLSTVVRVDSHTVCNVFPTYRPKGYTGEKAIGNLREKLVDKQFITDIDYLLTGKIDNYDPYEAAGIIIQEYLNNI